MISFKESVILDAKILPTKDIRGIGNNWFKDLNTGVCYHVVSLDDGALVVAETRQSKTRRQKPIAVVIRCVDCGDERNVKSQDKHQVKRCKECQRLHRLKQRREYLARKREEKANADNKD